MFRCSVCVALVLLASDAAAEKVTLDRALALADAQHPLLRAGAAQVEAAAAGIVTASAYPNPQSTFIAGKQLQPPGNPRNGVPLYVLEQPLELGALRPTRIELAQRGKESSEHFLGEVRLGVLSHVRRTFFHVLRRMGEVRIAAENLKLVQDLRNRIQVRVDVGEVGRLELVRAEAEVASAQTLASSAQLQQVTAVAQFRAAVGGGLEPSLDFDGQLDQQVPLPPIEQIRQEAIANHPALSLARSEIRRAEARVNYETALKRPQFSLRGEIDMKGTQLLLLIQGKTDKTTPNFVLTGQPFRVTRNWTEQTVVLKPDPQQWTCLGARHDMTHEYGCDDVTKLLRDVNLDIIFALFPLKIVPLSKDIKDLPRPRAAQAYPVDIEALPKGLIMFDTVKIEYPNR